MCFKSKPGRPFFKNTTAHYHLNLEKSPEADLTSRSKRDSCSGNIVSETGEEVKKKKKKKKMNK